MVRPASGPYTARPAALPENRQARLGGIGGGIRGSLPHFPDSHSSPVPGTKVAAGNSRRPPHPSRFSLYQHNNMQPLPSGSSRLQPGVLGGTFGGKRWGYRRQRQNDHGANIESDKQRKAGK